VAAGRRAARVLNSDSPCGERKLTAIDCCIASIKDKGSAVRATFASVWCGQPLSEAPAGGSMPYGPTGHGNGRPQDRYPSRLLRYRCDNGLLICAVSVLLERAEKRPPDTRDAIALEPVLAAGW
jgi:hypothetical protein